MTPARTAEFCFWGIIFVFFIRIALAGECMFYRVESTQPTHIIEFDSSGMLTWSNTVPVATCRIESLPSLTGTSNSSFTAEIPCSNQLTSVRMPLRPLAAPVLLSIYSDGWGTLLERWAVPVDVPVAIEIEEAEPYFDPPQYYAYAHQDGCYTELLCFTNSTTEVFHLNTVTNAPLTMTGVIFAQQGFFRDCCLTNHVLSVTNWSGPLPDVMTDEYGRYTIAGTETGSHTLSFTYQDQLYSFELNNTYGTDYEDLYFWEPYQAAAPNIYLYPESETNVHVTLDFPNDGHVTVSEPDYDGGWDVSVDTNGIIEDTYSYLFYEAAIPHPLKAEKGWLLDGRDLENELRNLLADLGFVGREIDDFVDYWLPLMQGPAWYAVYWQDADEVTTLNVSPGPDNVFRAHFVFRALARPIEITAPELAPFTRTGFTVAEWGVLGWEAHPAH